MAWFPVLPPLLLAGKWVCCLVLPFPPRACSQRMNNSRQHCQRLIESEGPSWVSKERSRRSAKRTGCGQSPPTPTSTSARRTSTLSGTRSVPPATHTVPICSCTSEPMKPLVSQGMGNNAHRYPDLGSATGYSWPWVSLQPYQDCVHTIHKPTYTSYVTGPIIQRRNLEPINMKSSAS